MSTDRPYDLSDELIEVKTEELKTSGIDYAFCVALGYEILVSKYYDRYDIYTYPEMPQSLGTQFSVHSSWNTLGPYLEQFRIGFKFNDENKCEAFMEKDGVSHSAIGYNQRDSSCLLIIRAFLGDTVKIPKSIAETM